ncbi:MAG: Na(+)/H(+) antiporter subunit D [Deltaproteobacteria bacterium]|jgi:multicomponent Na+:H+ antiporter subunit D|nr:Na(+)/H(+) antiporter subunit D [Deltaproteobacteria bacterium]MBW2503787.1 Na(+)/H(+) antiporter subunit D [Deltaproteobacteria bacterium]MBW2520680.1 Na(+)/H(+) antiporter subunit D [Deltaproteobacteria bacterium]
MTVSSLHPTLVFFAGAVLLWVLPLIGRRALILLVPATAFFLISQLEPGTYCSYQLFGYELNLLRVDKLSKAFGYVFTLNAFGCFLFAQHLKERYEHAAALTYIGAALGAVFAADLISLYLFWEVMAITSTFLVLARKTERAYGAAFRYVMAHIFGGLCLLAGILLQVHNTGSVAFNGFELQGLPTYLILIGFLVNAAAPPMNAWLSDAYPEATVTGGIIMTAYTTKTAVYTLIRGFAGWDILMVVGCTMAIYGIIWAILENDMRRILAYSIMNQVGFMICGIGIGTAMALNGAVAHAFAHIIYKALLWMSAGAVLYMTGKSKCTDLGGLYKTMPLTMIFGTIGALAISSFPLLSGYTTKPMIIEAGVHEHLFWVWLVLEIASAGVFLHAGIKFPYFVFFAKDNGLRPGEPPKHMLAAMALLAFICIFLGVYPQPLYNILPFGAVEFHAYTLEHTLNQLQLLMFSALAFFMLLPLLKRTETISIDTDWVYRKGGRLFYRFCQRTFDGINDWANRVFAQEMPRLLARFFDEPGGNVQKYGYRLWVDASGINDGQTAVEEQIDRRSRSGAYPVGGGVLLAVMFLSLMAFLLFL